jgi:hypothetical protein
VAKIKQVLNLVAVEEAKRKRICHRNRKKHVISGGERCLVVRDPASGGKRNYCVECGNEILDVAADDLHALRTGLNG